MQALKGARKRRKSEMWKMWKIGSNPSSDATGPGNIYVISDPDTKEKQQIDSISFLVWIQRDGEHLKLVEFSSSQKY